MGIYSALAKLVINERQSYELGGCALTLGVHHFNYGQEELISMFRDAGAAPPDTTNVIPNQRIRVPWLKADALDARTFFHWLGYATVDEMDIHSEESPSLVHNLNDPIPKSMNEKYDLVFDGGTTEHIFDIKTTLFNIVNLLKPGGTIVHAVPLSGWINHGFFHFCPILLWEFYRASGFTQLQAYVLRVDRVAGVPTRIWKIEIPETPLLFNDFSCKTLFVFFARKSVQSEPVVPLQGAYPITTPSRFGGGKKQPIDYTYISRSEPVIRSVVGEYGGLFEFLWKLMPAPLFSFLHSVFLERIFNRRTAQGRSWRSDAV